MLAHLRIPALDDAISTVSHPIVTGLLKQKLGFKGLVITDALCMGALKENNPGEVELQAFLAGNDLFVCSLGIPKAIDCLEAAVVSGVISEDVINERVLKILEAKEYAGLFSEKSISLSSAIATPQAYALKKKLYEESMTLVQNNESVLPLSRGDGQLWDVIQIGGEEDSAFIRSCMAYGAHAAHCIPADMSCEVMSEMLQKLQHAPTIIVGLRNINKTAKSRDFGIAENTISLLKTLQESGKHVVLVLFGNPYCLHRFENESAIIMAYEDDSDAQQAAVDVIMGALEPRGKLAVTASEKFHYGLGLSTGVKIPQDIC
jgi:beta-N-acetylhexosaminidase